MTLAGILIGLMGVSKYFPEESVMEELGPYLGNRFFRKYHFLVN